MAAAQALKDVARIIPPLSKHAHKGQAGRVGVLGGSKDYTGAPFFSCHSAMLLGADLGHIICEPSAGNVIKTYSPDIIVHREITEQYNPDTLRKTLQGLMGRLHAMVVGPGLGRDDAMQNAARMAIEIAKEEGMYLVLDADGLWLINNHPELIKGYKKAVLTPNVIEYGRLADKMNVHGGAKDLAAALGNVTILQKGQTDYITNGKEVLECNETGGLKRCGGQGDVLSGTTGCFLAWAKCFEEEHGEKDIPLEKMTLLAALGGATVTRTCSRLGFEQAGRAMQTTDVLKQVGKSYAHHFG